MAAAIGPGVIALARGRRRFIDTGGEGGPSASLACDGGAGARVAASREDGPDDALLTSVRVHGCVSTRPWIVTGHWSASDCPWASTNVERRGS